jgi:hypothetical protein
MVGLYERETHRWLKRLGDDSESAVDVGTAEEEFVVCGVPALTFYVCVIWPSDRKSKLASRRAGALRGWSA